MNRVHRGRLHATVHVWLVGLMGLFAACATTDGPSEREKKSHHDKSDYELRYLDRMLGTRRQISPKALQEALAAAAQAEAEPAAQAPPEAPPVPPAANAPMSAKDAAPSRPPAAGQAAGRSASATPSPPPPQDSPIPREQVREVISGHYADIQRCYEKMLEKNPKFKGRLVLKFVVSPQGQVMKTTVEKDRTTPPAKELQACMVQLAARWKFPPPGGKRPVLVVSDPFAFE